MRRVRDVHDRTLEAVMCTVLSPTDSQPPTSLPLAPQSMIHRKVHPTSFEGNAPSKETCHEDTLSTSRQRWELNQPGRGTSAKANLCFTTFPKARQKARASAKPCTKEVMGAEQGPNLNRKGRQDRRKTKGKQE